MTYLLDTGTLSQMTRPRPSPLLVSTLASAPQGALFTSTITLGEMLYGAFKNRERTAHLVGQIEHLIASRLTVLPFDEAAARVYARIRADLEANGNPTGEADTRGSPLSRLRTVLPSSPGTCATLPASRT